MMSNGGSFRSSSNVAGKSSRNQCLMSRKCLNSRFNKYGVGSAVAVKEVRDVRDSAKVQEDVKG